MPKNNIDELMSIALDKWTKTELPALSQAVLGSNEASSADVSTEKAAIENELRALRALVERSSGSNKFVGSTDVSAIAELQARTSVVPPVTAPEKVSSNPAKNNDDSTAKTALKVAGMVTGLGPLITGLVGLFGSGGDEPVVAVPQPYTAPERVNVEAGLDGRRTFTSIAYGQDGVARGVQQNASQPRVEIHVQAMDSRSFLDHSDEIAQAVQTAMLRSHSLNDVVAEL